MSEESEMTVDTRRRGLKRGGTCSTWQTATRTVWKGLHGVSFSGHSHPILATSAKYGLSPGGTGSRCPGEEAPEAGQTDVPIHSRFCSLEHRTNPTTLRASPILAYRVQYIYRLRERYQYANNIIRHTAHSSYVAVAASVVADTDFGAVFPTVGVEPVLPSTFTPLDVSVLRISARPFICADCRDATLMSICKVVAVCDLRIAAGRGCPDGGRDDTGTGSNPMAFSAGR